MILEDTKSGRYFQARSVPSFYVDLIAFLAQIQAYVPVHSKFTTEILDAEVKETKF